MKACVHQPNFLPYLGFFNKIKHSDLFVIYDVAQYVRDRFDNRNRIKGVNGPVWLTVPLQVKDSFKKRFSEVKLPIDNSWRKKHLRSIEVCYSRTPYFQRVFPEIERIYLTPYDLLADLSWALIEFQMKALGLTTRVVKTSDLRLDLNLSSSEMLLQILQRVEADEYLAGPSGRNYMDLDLFTRAGIFVEFQQFAHPCYRQLYGEFLPHLAALDLLFNEGDKAGSFI